MTSPHALPYPGALDAVKRIETALTERDAARETLDAELDAARAQAERLLSVARDAGTRAGEQRRLALLARADADAAVIRSTGEAQARELGGRIATRREAIAAEFTALLLVEEP